MFTSGVLFHAFSGVFDLSDTTWVVVVCCGLVWLGIRDRTAVWMAFCLVVGR